MKMRRYNIGVQILAAGVLVLLQLLMVAGCGKPQGRIFEPLAKPLVWPKPPDTPRVRYVGQISTEADLKKKVSFGQGLKDVFFGKEEISVLVGPYAVVRDGEDKLFIADTGSSVIGLYDLANREHRSFSRIDGGAGLATPVALTLVGENVYVADSTLKKICVFDKKGKFLFSFGQEQLKRPTGIAYSSRFKRLYVSDTGNHTVVVYNGQGEFLRTIGQRGTGAGDFNFPTHLWVDNQDRLYVSDTLNYRIQIFTADGKYISSFGAHGDSPGLFAHPSGVATDSFGNIYVVDRKFENIQIFNSDGKVLMAIGSEGSEPGQFWLPGGIFIDDGNRIYVADSYNKRIQVFEFIAESISR
ncbi:MAG: 6-bladed beta-propeller [Phycisphaerae bacterium]|nr:6-bladed beta-propeller [Phycisphaerae bacterium]